MPFCWLVVFQAGLTALGNLALAAATFNLLRLQRRPTASGIPSSVSSDVS